MAKFGIQRATGTLPGRAPTVRANIPIDTGEQAIGAAAAGVGGAVADLGLKFDLKQANTELSQYQRKVGESNVQRDIEIANELDPSKHDEIFTRFADQQKALFPTNNRAQQAAKIWDNRQAPIQLGLLLEGKRARVEDNWRAELFEKQAAVARTGDIGDFEAFLARGIIIDRNDPTETGRPLDKKEAAKILADTRKMAEVGGIKKKYLAGNFTEARTATNESALLTIKERESLLVTIDVAERRKNAALTEADRIAQTILYRREDEGELLTRQDFLNTWTNPEEADKHYDEYIAGKSAEARGEIDFVKNGDPITLARVEAAIDLNPLVVTEGDLYSKATSGIGTTNITRLVDRLREAKEKLYTPEKKYDTQFATLLNAGYFGDKDEIETSTIYLERKRIMTEYLKSQKPSELAADAFFRGLITEDFAVKGWFTGAGGGWNENGFKHTYKDENGAEVTQRFRFGDIRIVDGVEHYYAGTNDKGRALWIPRQ